MTHHIDHYAGGSSLWHTCDPRVKLVAFSCLILAVAAGRSLVGAAVGLAVAVSLTIQAKIPLKFVAMRLKEVAVFLGLFLVVLPWSHPAGVGAGLQLAATLIVKGLALVVLLFPMLGTTRFDVSMKALSKLGLSEKLIQLILFAYRYLFVFRDELRSVLNAQRLRGFRPRTDVRTLKTAGYLVGGLMVRSFERQEMIAKAMRARGYDGRYRALGRLSLRGSDWVKGAAIVALAGLLAVLEWSRWS